MLALPDDALDRAAGARPRGADALVRAGGRGRGHRLAEDRRLPGGLPLLLPVGAVRLAGALGVAGHPDAGRGGEADGGDRRDGVLHRRRGARARRAADGADRGRASRRSGTRSTSTSPARWACSPRSRSTSWPRWACTATTTTSRPRARTSRRSSPPTPGRSAGRRCGWSATPAWRCAAAGSSAWARPWRSGPSSPPSSPSSDPHEVPLNFLNPRPGTPFGDLEPLPGGGRAAHHRRVPAGPAAHDPAVRRRPRDHPRRPGHAGGAARRDQRGDRRQLPDHAGRARRRRTSPCSASCRCRSRR